MKSIICALCGVNQRIKILYPANYKKKISPEIFSARRTPDNIHYQIVKCQKCSLVFSTPVLTSRKIAKLYQNSTCIYAEHIPYLVKTYLKLFNQIKQKLPNRRKVLEIGCGNGFFLHALSENDLSEVFGVEPSKKMAAQASLKIRKKITVDIFRKNQFPKNYFNLICSFHTLDHVVDANEFAYETFRLLKKDGFILIVVHNIDNLFVKLLGEKSPIFDIEHVYLFNKSTLNRLFTKHGFKVLKISSLINTYPISYWWQMTPFYSNIKYFVNQFLEKSKLGKLPISLSAGNIYMIAQKTNIYNYF